MTLPRNPRPHLLLPDNLTKTEPYRANNAGSRNIEIPAQPRGRQALQLRAGLEQAATSFAQIKTEQQAAGWESGFGLTVRFASFPDVELAIDSLDQRQAGIELLNVRQSGTETLAAVWVPEGKLELFERKIADYVAQKTDKNGNPRDNRKLVDAIREIRTAVIEDLWIDDSPVPPDNEIARFEAWISTPRAEAKGDASQIGAAVLNARIERFKRIARLAQLQVGEKALQFPERAVLQVRGTIAQLRGSVHLLGQVAELRRAPETPHFFMHLAPDEQREWATELLGRTQFPPPDDTVPYVCVLDTGSTQAHPLLAPALAPADLHSVNPAWGTADENGHGTEQSAIALWGDLAVPMESGAPVALRHRLESVKLMPHDDANREEHFGPLTAEAVSRPEIHAPFRRRLFSLAVTSTKTTMRGRPTAWSAEVDALTSDWSGNGESPRLMIVSGGNVPEQKPNEYSACNSTTSIEDPAQAWNALTVGALTHKTQITEPNTAAFTPIASTGGLSPYSSTSSVWHRERPFKPDVVFEGGNLAHDGALVSRFDSLSLLTAHHKPAQRLLSTSGATSAATAVASRFSAQVMARYPDLWPETVRALTVHSAKWTPQLLAQYPGDAPADTEHRLRHCGWGEPDLDLALHSGADSLTLLVQGTLQPFGRKEKRKEDGKTKGGNITARDMHLHKLPWPQDALQDLLEQDVELRVTLSYFIEPNPGERGRSSRFIYASHGLRFAVQKPTEKLQAFRARINQLAADAEAGIEPAGGGDRGWILGSRKRFRGSIHHDRLTCSAVDLASRGHIAIFPTGGWWKTREAQQRFEREARYALVVSIQAPDLPIDVDLYTAVQQIIQTPVAVVIPIGL
ncbi:S8 family peptidase [Panacagrimonas sp.]|uniref:S8 family peptidase n=1 Tax=Panacagrimonas sp. TaxID=2480088 RepID=UPI003B5183B6